VFFAHVDRSREDMRPISQCQSTKQETIFTAELQTNELAIDVTGHCFAYLWQINFLTNVETLYFSSTWFCHFMLFPLTS